MNEMNQHKDKAYLAAALAWAASPENKDEQLRATAKDILNTLCYLQHQSAAVARTKGKGAAK